MKNIFQYRKNPVSKKEMLYRFSFIIAIILFIIGIFFGGIFLDHKLTTYNEQNNYFDEVTGIVYQDQSLIFYGLVSILSFALATTVLWIFGVKKR